MEFAGLTPFEAYKSVKDKLLQNNVQEAEREARLLIAEAIGGEVSDIFIKPDVRLSGRQAKKLVYYIKRRLSGMPLQYAMKTAYFMGMKFYVDKRVLIPRPETELLVEKSLMLLGGKKSVLDICTGSGCIAVSIAAGNKDADITASDKYAGALAVAQKNAVDCGLSERITFIKSNLFERIYGSFDMIVSNPPYISRNEYEKLDAHIRLYEPKHALLAADDGLDFYSKIAKSSVAHLKKGGWLLLETGASQGSQVIEILKNEGYGNIYCYKDYSGLDRIVTAQNK